MSVLDPCMRCGAEYPPHLLTYSGCPACTETPEAAEAKAELVAATSAVRELQERESRSVGLDLADLRRASVARAARWHTGAEEWSGADWSNAMCGEAGEAANVVKKLRRQETGIQQPGPARTELLAALRKELADVVIYVDLLAAHYDLDLSGAVVEKFNEVSNRYGFPERLPHATCPCGAGAGHCEDCAALADAEAQSPDSGGGAS